MRPFSPRLFLLVSIVLAAIFIAPQPSQAAAALSNSFNGQSSGITVNMNNHVAIGFHVPAGNVVRVTGASIGYYTVIVKDFCCETLEAAIHADAGGAPGGMIGALGSRMFNMPAYPAFHTFSPSTGVVLEGGQTYWVVLKGRNYCWVDSVMNQTCRGSLAASDNAPGGVFGYTGARISQSGGPWAEVAAIPYVSIDAELVSGWLQFPEDHINPNYGDHFGVVFANAKGVSVYAVNAKSRGLLVIFFDIGDLPDCPPEPEENTLLAESDDGLFVLWLLTTCELQVNMGPDEEGKIFVIIFDAAPLTHVYYYTLPE